MMRKGILLTIAILLALLTLSSPSMSATITAGDYFVSPGETFTINVTMESLGGQSITDFDYLLTINPNDSNLVAATTLNATPGAALPAPGFSAIATSPTTILTLYGQSSPAPLDITDGILGSYDLTVSGAAEFGDSWSLDFSNLNFSSNAVPVNPPVGSINGSVSVVPIPGSILLLGSGLVGLVGLARRRRSR